MIVTARKIISVGNSSGITIPPHVLDHLHVAIGDMLGWDITVKGYAYLTYVHVPPYFGKDLELPPARKS